MRRLLAFLWWLFCAWVLTANALNAMHDGNRPMAALWIVGVLMSFDNLRDTEDAS